MGRRTLLLITSILVAAVGTALIGLYVRGADTRAEGRQLQQTVLVASADIPAGTAVDSGAFKVRTEQRTVTSLPVGAMADLSPVAKLSTTSKIYLNQVIQQEMFSTASGVTTAGISPNDIGITVDLQDPARAAGLLKLGSKVTIFATPKGGKKSVVLLPGITVIQIGNERAGGSTGSSEDVPSTIVGLDVTVSQAELIKDAEAGGSLYFGVESPGAGS